MTKEQFLEKYGKENTVVNCKTKELAREFLTDCEKFGVGGALILLDYWDRKKENTCYNLNEGCCLTYAPAGWYEYKGFTVIPFETEPNDDFNKEVKELVTGLQRIILEVTYLTFYKIIKELDEMFNHISYKELEDDTKVDNEKC